MKVVGVIAILLFAGLVASSPDDLQRLYSTPGEGATSETSSEGSNFGVGADSRSATLQGPTQSQPVVGSFSAQSDSGVGLNTDSISDFSNSNSAGGPGSRFAVTTDDGFGRSSERIGADLNSGSSDGPVVSSQPKVLVSSGEILTDNQFGSDQVGHVTVTQVSTIDIFKTSTNSFYNSVPVTITQFAKTTAVSPTLLVVTTPVDDRVFVATAPVTRTHTMTVTDTSTAHRYVTEVSTDIFTVTHRAYDIQQQVVTSTAVETQVFHPTVVSTRISTEYEAETVLHTVTNTVVVEFPSAGGPFTNPNANIFDRRTAALNQGSPLFADERRRLQEERDFHRPAENFAIRNSARGPVSYNYL